MPRQVRGDHRGPEPDRRIVAVVLTHGDSTCLLRRSVLVGSDRGRWHCITGFLEQGRDPERQALDELVEETGLCPTDLLSYGRAAVLTLPDGRSGTWQVIVYRAEARHRAVRLNWENDRVCWTPWEGAGTRLDLVPWLHDVVRSTQVGTEPAPARRRRTAAGAHRPAWRQPRARLCSTAPVAALAGPETVATTGTRR